MTIVMILILFGIACALIAGNKNRSALAWFIGGCLFGIFALVAVAIAPKLRAD